MQSGISRLAPPEPESRLHSLPPILRNTCQVPIPSCSKGPRGLSVLPRVTSIFTRSAISPSPQLRQCPSRYAIRAGRNLPDKEFRYLRQMCYSQRSNRCCAGGTVISAALPASPRGSDCIFAGSSRTGARRAVSEGSPKTSRYLRCFPLWFIEDANSTILRNPSSVLCSFRDIRPTIAQNLRKSFVLVGAQRVCIEERDSNCLQVTTPPQRVRHDTAVGPFELIRPHPKWSMII
jgi:hypothetical protein